MRVCSRKSVSIWMCRNYNSIIIFTSAALEILVSLWTWALLRAKRIIDIAHPLLSSAGSIVAVPDTAKEAIHMSARIYGSAGSIVTAPDTATEDIYMAVRYIRFGRVYRNRTGYCKTSYMQCATLYTIRYAMSNCPAPWSGPGTT